MILKRNTSNRLLATVLVLLTWSTSLCADNSDPFPAVNPHDYYGNMSLTVKVVNGSEALQDVTVAVFSGKEIRGKGSPSNVRKPGVTYLTVYGNHTGEDLAFSVYLKSQGLIYWVDYDKKYVFNGIVGTSKSPYILDVANSTGSVILSETDGITSDIATMIAGQPVRFSRSFTQGKASTICLPFAMTGISGGKIYEFVSVVCDPTEGWVATMSDATPDGNQVFTTDANKPYLFLPDGSGSVMFEGTVPNDPATILSGTTTNGDWTYHGTFTKLTYGTDPFTGTVFGFAATDGTSIDGKSEVVAGQFVKAGTGAYMPAFRAYLTYSGNKNALQAPARGSAGTSAIPSRITVKLVSRSGAVTGVGSLDITTGEAVMDRWFELSGRPVDGVPTEPGIYINGNGKKVVIR